VIDYLAIGHVTEDLWPEGPTPGGTVTYSSRAARKFLEKVTVLTAASAGTDTNAAFPNIDAYCLAAPNTTQFRNIYTAGGRVQVVSPCPIMLEPAYLTEDMRASRIVHLGPVCNEVSTEIVCCFHPNTFIGITPQGWMRRWDEQGHVVSRADNWTDAGLVLSHASAVVTSIDDVAGNWSVAHHWASQTRLLIVTQGALGCTAFYGGNTLQTPAPAVQEVEPTGAGDIFATVLFIALQRGDTLRDACALANCIAAQSVTRPHLAGVPTGADIALCQRMPLK
jgi:hypothetical protein